MRRRSKPHQGKALEPPTVVVVVDVVVAVVVKVVVFVKGFEVVDSNSPPSDPAVFPILV